MNTLFIYIRDRRGRIAAFALFSLIFRVVCALYQLPIEPFAYAFGLCAFLGLGIAAADFAAWRNRRRSLREALERIDISLDRLPEPNSAIEADYQALARAGFDAARAQASRSARERAGLTEYYTLWTHQVKTPIAAMRLIMQDGDAGPYQALRAELFRIERYVDMALCYSRLDGGSSDFVIREYPLDGIVRQAVRRYAPVFIQKRISLALAPIDIRVNTDEKWLCFAIEQVLSNALKYTSKGSVSISVEAGSTLVIRDTGAGIPPEDLPRVFEHSFTGLNGRADKRATGLGLYLTRRVLSRLGHGIRIESAPGAGTAVLIDLSRDSLDARD